MEQTWQSPKITKAISFQSTVIASLLILFVFVFKILKNKGTTNVMDKIMVR